jgi:hypothetical protein
MNAFARANSLRLAVNFFALLSLCAALCAPAVFAQSQTQSQSQPAAAPPSAAQDSASALTAALSAACRQNSSDFANYLTNANAAAFKSLSEHDQLSLMERFVLLDTKGRPLLATTTDGRTLLRCEAADASQGFTFSAPEAHDNLAYISVAISSGESIRFGLVREDSNWKLLSIGLLLIDIPQLQKEWAAQSLKENEQAVIDLLHGLQQAVIRYQDAFGRLPDTLSQLGPTEKGQGISPSAAGFVDSDIASGAKDGYEFRYRLNTPAGSDTPAFEIAAVPQQYGKSGQRSFLLDEHGHIHAADHRGAVATLDDPLIPDQPAASQQ